MEQRVDIDEGLMAFYHKLNIDTSDTKAVAKSPPPLKIALKAVRYSAIEMEEMTNTELIESFIEIQKISHLSETEKKS